MISFNMTVGPRPGGAGVRVIGQIIKVSDPRQIEINCVNDLLDCIKERIEAQGTEDDPAQTIVSFQPIGKIQQKLDHDIEDPPPLSNRLPDSGD